MTVEVSRLFYYPVKSLHRVEVDQAQIEPTGIAGDREYMVIDEVGVLISQREEPALATLDPAAVIAASRRGGKRWSVTLHRWEGVGEDQGDEVAALVSDHIGRPARVVRFPDGYERETSLGGGTTKYPDGYPLLIASERSLDEVNSWLDEPVPIERFRPSIVLRGLEQPFVEDEIATLQVGEVTIDLVKLCERCVMTTIDQDTGDKGREPLKTLGAHRVRPALGGGQGIMFAVNAIPRSTGTIRVGDAAVIALHDAPYDERLALGSGG